MESDTTITDRLCTDHTTMIPGKWIIETQNTTTIKMAYAEPGRIGRGQHDLHEPKCEKANCRCGAHSE